MSAGKSLTATVGGQPTAPPDSRTYLMRSIFRDPWKNLLQTATSAAKALNTPLPSDANDVPKAIAARFEVVKTSREQIQTISWLILLDFANFLSGEMPRIWKSLNGETVTPALNNAENALVSAISNTTLENDFAADLIINTPNPPVYTANQVRRSLKAALLAVRPANEEQPGNIEKNLEKVVISYDRKSPNALYPKFLFPLADAKFSLKTVLDGATVSITPTNFLKTQLNQTIPNEANKVKDGEDYVNRIAQMVEAALPPAPPNQAFQPIPLAAQTPMDMREGWFLMRCVYERPLCGAIDPPVLSDATEPFQIAGFFDPDAPARPIRIGLPIDTTPAGLRKFDKNTAFMMSDLLCGQVNRMKGITFADLIFSILPFPFHKSLDVPDTGGCKDNFGMMCSLSIPIITLCALILLIIIVTLLDFIFKWLPFLIVCFPLPGLRAKDE